MPYINMMSQNELEHMSLKRKRCANEKWKDICIFRTMN